jgi:uncharacterized membrane protein YdjX (TVP38/TMEM64 family)
VAFLVRLHVDKRLLKHTLREWGVLAPVIFIGLQALQVIVAPIPGDITSQATSQASWAAISLGNGSGSSTRRSA